MEIEKTIMPKIKNLINLNIKSPNFQSKGFQSFETSKNRK